MNLKAYFELTKPRLASLVMLSAFVGFFLATKGPLDYLLMLWTLGGTALVSAGSMALNQWMEADHDAKMKRTKIRPIPAGEVSKKAAFVFGVFLSVVGLMILFFTTNYYATLIAFSTTMSYLFIYTPMKRKTSLCTIVGAIPGALPPLIGWSAVTGASPSYEAWVLFAIIFLWQMPHFLAIAWLHREDFKQAGFKMLSVENPDGKQVKAQMLLYSAALLPVSLLPTFIGLVGHLYFFSAFILGLIVVALEVAAFKNMDKMARPLFRTSILYLTVIFILLMVDKV